MWAPPWGPSVSIIPQAELVGWLTQKVGLSDVTLKQFILPCFDFFFRDYPCDYPMFGWAKSQLSNDYQNIRFYPSSI
jgi:hypothetical protein